MSTHDVSRSVAREVWVKAPLLGREARVVVTPSATGVKPEPLKNAPTLQGDKLMAELVTEARR